MTTVGPSWYLFKLKPQGRMKAFFVALMRYRLSLTGAAELTHPSLTWVQEPCWFDGRGLGQGLCARYAGGSTPGFMSWEWGEDPVQKPGLWSPQWRMLTPKWWSLGVSPNSTSSPFYLCIYFLIHLRQSKWMNLVSFWSLLLCGVLSFAHYLQQSAFLYNPTFTVLF